MLKDNKNEQFLKKLQNLLTKYNATIEFTCDDSSDTWSITGEGMIITIRNQYGEETMIYKSRDWYINKNTFEDSIII